MKMRAMIGLVALTGSYAAIPAYDYYLQVKAVKAEQAPGPIYLIVDERLAAGAGVPREGVVRLLCSNGALRSATMQWTGGSGEAARKGKSMGTIKMEATAITSIGLPKITPKIAKESHGRVAMPGGGWEPIAFDDPAEACAVAAKAVAAAAATRR